MWFSKGFQFRKLRFGLEVRIKFRRSRLYGGDRLKIILVLLVF